MRAGTDTATAVTVCASKGGIMFVTVGELRVGDRVLPTGTHVECDVVDLHTVSVGGRYRTVAVTLDDGYRQFTSRVCVFQLVSAGA